jgi:hypothetical protein
MAMLAVPSAGFAAGCFGMFLGRILGERSCLAFGSALQRLELSEQLGDESFELRDAAFQGDTVGTSRLRHTGSLPKIALRSCASLKSALGWLNTLNNYYQVTVLHCAFDGKVMTYLKHGNELAIKGGRGFCEPSLAFFQGKYYLTLRNDARAYVTTSKDGLHFEAVKPWTFDDGKDLGSYNTQAHWLTHSGGLFLSYTRRGANNDHITRNRAPLFVAQVDPAKLQVIRRTEQALLPERGAMLGNFGSTAIIPEESWVTDAEFIVNGKPHPRGADGTVWLGRVKWAPANRLVK